MYTVYHVHIHMSEGSWFFNKKQKNKNKIITVLGGPVLESVESDPGTTLRLAAAQSVNSALTITISKPTTAVSIPMALTLVGERSHTISNY